MSSKENAILRPLPGLELGQLGGGLWFSQVEKATGFMAQGLKSVALLCQARL